jgi:phosphoribosylaminoimidazolecarboxamide formyltransferase / IMP cyclohydrolase
VYIRGEKKLSRALISVSDKTGIVDFAKGLIGLGWEIISTGGTYKELKKAGLDVVEVSSITGFPEAFDGRVKTLHPNIHGGILYRRDNADDLKTVEDMDIGSIDMVVVNLYPFREVYERGDSTTEELIENIDIGGPTLIRAAGKNYKDVNVIVNPKDYEFVFKELKEHGKTSEQIRLNLSKKAFSHTASYDSMISKYFNEVTKDEFPEKLVISYDKKIDLRYGENPHQSAAFYTESIGSGEGLAAIVKHNGKELSYNNINDINEGVELIREFTEEPTAVAIKHGNPCGVASDQDLFAAFKKAYEADSQSIFGGVVIFNREVDVELAEFLNRLFLEIVVAPSYSKKAIETLSKKVNLRVLEQPEIITPMKDSKLFKTVDGGLLAQDRDNLLIGQELKCVTERSPNEKDLEDLLFAWKVVKSSKSNAVVIAKDKVTVAIGPGQVSRIGSLENAIDQAGEKVKGAVLASDAFFPFSDSVELASKSGIKSIIQPGGSKKDDDSIKAADENEISMVFTGIRHFKH